MSEAYYLIDLDQVGTFFLLTVHNKLAKPRSVVYLQICTTPNTNPYLWSSEDSDLGAIDHDIYSGVFRARLGQQLKKYHIMMETRTVKT